MPTVPPSITPLADLNPTSDQCLAIALCEGPSPGQCDVATVNMHPDPLFPSWDLTVVSCDTTGDVGIPLTCDSGLILTDESFFLAGSSTSGFQGFFQATTAIGFTPFFNAIDRIGISSDQSGLHSHVVFLNNAVAAFRSALKANPSDDQFTQIIGNTPVFTGDPTTPAECVEEYNSQLKAKALILTTTISGSPIEKVLGVENNVPDAASDPMAATAIDDGSAIMVAGSNNSIGITITEVNDNGTPNSFKTAVPIYNAGATITQLELGDLQSHGIDADRVVIIQTEKVGSEYSVEATWIDSKTGAVVGHKTLLDHADFSPDLDISFPDSNGETSTHRGGIWIRTNPHDRSVRNDLIGTIDFDGSVDLVDASSSALRSAFFPGITKGAPLQADTVLPGYELFAISTLSDGRFVLAEDDVDPTSNTSHIGLAIFDPNVVSPLVAELISSSITGEVDAGQTVQLTVQMSETLVVTGGLPTLSLNDGGVATYDPGQSNPTSGRLVFDYTVGGNDHTADLQVVAGNSNGATIQNPAGQDADFSAILDTSFGVQVGPPPVSTVTTVEAFAAVASNPAITGLAVLDSTTNVVAGLDGLEAIHKAIASIALSDATPPTISLTGFRYLSDIDVINDITSPFNLTLTLNAGANSIPAPANNPVNGSGGQDVILGDGLHDQVTFTLPSTTFSLAKDNAGGVTLSGGSGQPTYQLDQVEFLKFNDQTAFIENADNANIARLYSAALGRSPDSGGLSGWEDIYAHNISASAKAGGVYLSLAQTNDGFGTSIAGGFALSPEFLSKYGTLSDAGFVSQLYVNVLDRTPSTPELNAWLDLMHNSGFSRDMVLVGFAESPENIAKTAGWLIQV